VEVDIGDIAPGGMKTVEWRGKPVWIQRRTAEMIAALKGQEAQLADPASARDDLPEALRNPGRSMKPEVFVAVGICTHLGCSPSAVAQGSGNPSVGADWHGGFFCPCHGSTFDLAGRVFKNKPAPTNLEIPPHRYLSDSRLLIGESDAA
jgi:ubiquinol-cytochrome c reductase iron-sulfur subunit